MKPISEATNEDCMVMMSRYPDNFFDLAIVDPPYGIDIVKGQFEKYGGRKEWDKLPPDNKYFNQLQRVSKHQIVWGGNYFIQLWGKPCKGFIFWNKLNHHDNRSDGEFAWTSFDKLPLYFEYMWDGNRYGFKGNIQGVGMPTIRIHPTEKPIALYEWLLMNYAEPGNKIIDTHMGSQSSRIAAHKLGFDYWGTEIDKEYFEKGNQRFKEQTAQIQLF
jgi:site-specific DNA-methyltransferase (adenine-specific)